MKLNAFSQSYRACLTILEIAFCSIRSN